MRAAPPAANLAETLVPPPAPLPGKHRDPIVAIASAQGRGAVGIVRASGRDLSVLIAAVCGRMLQPRQATLLPFLAADGQALDRGLALHFPAPHSYTGEDVLELQAHGGAVLLQLLLARCLQAQPGLRLAEPGEFTERAFLNDKLDLAQAEAVADLIDASTESAARSAARSLSGAFSAQVGLLADRIVRLRMLVEATLDFPEEEIDFLEKAGARAQLDGIEAAIAATLLRARQGALLREGLRVVLAGQPNVGKSSLLNALAGAELAIVTPIPGTTRDRVAETIQIEGVPLHITDTAGLRHGSEAADEVERLGIGRSWQAIGAADVVLLLHDLGRVGEPGYEAADEVERIGMGRSWEAIGGADAVVFLHDLARAGEPEYEATDAFIARQLPAEVSILNVYNKADLAGDAAVPAGGLPLSALTGQGLDVLRQALLQQAGWQAAPEGLFIARTRHVQALRRTQSHLRLAQQHAQARDTALDLLAEELRLAHRALGEITGAFSSEDLLGVIFSSFCIGK